MRPLAAEVTTPIIITLGAEGSIALIGDRVYTHPAVPVSRVVETTGCGDAYQAAFSVAWFQGGEIKKAMEAGAMAASRVLCHFGGV